MSPILGWIILGLLAGIIAKILFPGKDKGGLITTTLVGVGGSLLGGYLGQHFGLMTETGSLSFIGFATAICGAMLLLLALRVLRFLV